MGPPKTKPLRDNYDQKTRKYNYFEHRYDRYNKSYYLFNPWTGETIFGDATYVDRRMSSWAPKEDHPSTITVHTVMFSEFYQSRRWGRRPYHGWTTDCQCFPVEQQLNLAATHIAAVYRGYQARQALRRYFKLRYNKRLCPYSGYYYFYDTFNMDYQVETSWHKPLLAFPDDIEVYKPEDPDDYLQGKKYSDMGFELGPYCKREGLKRSGLVRAEHIAFLKPNQWRDAAIVTPAQIDVVNTFPLGSVVPVMDELKDIEYKIDDYSIVRSAIENNDWKRVLYIMHLHADRILVQIYGLLAFAKSWVPLDKKAGILGNEAKEVFDLCLYLIDDPDRCIRQTHRVFALMALVNILSLRAGRMEYFNVETVTVQGAKRKDSVDQFLDKRLRLLTVCLDNIEMETTKFSTLKDGVKVNHVTVIPTQRGCDIAEYAMRCLSLLSQNPEQRELMASVVPGSVIKCILKCNEESGIANYGLQFLYNCCYRNEHGQIEVLDTGLTDQLLDFVHTYFAGDFTCMRNCRRLELALQPDGWRGNVENKLEAELKDAAERQKPLRKEKPFNILDFLDSAETDKDELKFFSEALEKCVKFDDHYKDDTKGGYVYNIAEIKDARTHTEPDLDSKADSKESSHQYTTHKTTSKARDMKIDNEDIDNDALSVNSELTY